MTQFITDPTTGRRAAAIRKDPAGPHLRTDPTRGRTASAIADGKFEAVRITDPTDPRCGELANPGRD